MNRDKVLPPKLSIKDIQDHLDMRTFPLGNAEQQLCDHVNNKDFDLYVKNSSIDLYETKDIIFNNDGKSINAGSNPISIKVDLIVTSIKHLKAPSLFDEDYDSHNHHNQFFVDKVKDQGIDYHITKQGSQSVGVAFSEDNFYSLRDDIINYRKDDIYKDTLDKNRLDAQFLDVSSSSIDDNTPPYLDKESEFYSEELHLAIQVHKAIYIDKQGNPNRNKEQNVSTWIKNNKSDLKLSEAAFNRICAIISTKRIKRK